jgi:hypothetical protein
MKKKLTNALPHTQQWTTPKLKTCVGEKVRKVSAVDLLGFGTDFACFLLHGVSCGARAYTRPNFQIV